jgi:hypothetical protein
MRRRGVRNGSNMRLDGPQASRQQPLRIALLAWELGVPDLLNPIPCCDIEYARLDRRSSGSVAAPTIVLTP